MPSLNFASDNIAGASKPVLDAILAANAGPMPAYGTDPITAKLTKAFSDLFEREVEVVLVATGTAANALSLASVLSPWGLCLSHEEAHIIDDECGAPEFFTAGAKLLGLPGTGAKIRAEEIARVVDQLPRHEKQMPAELVSISQATECGLVYSLDELSALGEAAHSRGLKLHMDGARFANALVRLGCSPAEMTWHRGVDILSFGGTKNGCLAAEAVIVFDPAIAGTLRRRRKRSGHTLSKGRLLSAQFEGYLADDHWLENARHANAMAARLAQGLAEISGIRLAWPTEANEVFAILPNGVDETIRRGGAVYHPWSDRSLPFGQTIGEDEVLVRLVTAFNTEPESVERLLAAAREAA